MVSGAWKVPSPLPSSTETVLKPRLATTRSSLPSAFKSPSATEEAPLPAPKVSGARKVPSPFPSSTETVADGHGLRTVPSREGERRLESPIAVAQQHRDGAGTRVGHRQVRHSIAIEVALGDGERIRASSVGRRRLEGPIGSAQHS